MAESPAQPITFRLPARSPPAPGAFDSCHQSHITHSLPIIRFTKHPRCIVAGPAAAAASPLSLAQPARTGALLPLSDYNFQ